MMVLAYIRGSAVIRLLALLLLLLPGAACSASFDCAKASTEVEKMICSDPELSNLDATVKRGYELSQRDAKNAASSRKSQQQWLKERDQCKDVACLRKQYDQRIEAIDEIIKHGDYLAAGGRYRMINANFMYPNGEPYVERYADICTAFLENLNALPSDTHMDCEIKIAPGMKDFKVPEWRDIDVWEHQNLYLSALRLQPGTEQAEMALKNLPGILKGKSFLGFQTSEFDIDNDGSIDHVLGDLGNKYNGDEGAFSGPTCRSYSVYDPSSQEVDHEMNKFYQRYWGYSAGLGHSAFIYKGTTYIARFITGGGILLEPDYPEKDYPNKSYIELYRPNPMKPHGRPVAGGCKYVYLPTHKGSN